LIDNNSSFVLGENQILNIPEINIKGGSTLTLSGSETIAANTLTVSGNSTITVAPEKILSLTIPDINIEAGSAISADQKGYGLSAGPGAPVTYQAGASYGGMGSENTEASIYGSVTMPVDFGSGGNGYHPRGGGAIRLVITNNFVNNGRVSADGSNTSSGGSIYVTVNKIDGNGNFSANGGEAYCPNICLGPGGGGRIALYYKTSSFIGQFLVQGRSGNSGESKAGTIHLVDELNPPAPVPDPDSPPAVNETVTKLKIITSPQTIKTNTASGIITVESQNELGESTKVVSTTHVNLSSSSVTGVFSSASASKDLCDDSWGKTSITISKGDANKSFCYKDSASGTPTITVSADGISSDSQIFTIESTASEGDSPSL
jgi:hypothetical protein